MKILKTASGNKTIRISKKEWADIGKNAGWMKTAYTSEESKEWSKMVDDQVQTMDGYIKLLVALFTGDKIWINSFRQISPKDRTPKQVLDELNAEEVGGGKLSDEEPSVWKLLGKGLASELDQIEENWRKANMAKRNESRQGESIRRINMKLLKTASGKKTIRISKSEWQSIGEKVGWMKESAGWGTKFPDMTEDDWKKLDKSHKEKFQKFEDEKAEERKLSLEERRREEEDYKKREEIRRQRRLKEVKDNKMA